MAMATISAPVKINSAISHCICLLISVILVVNLNHPALAKADHPAQPSSLVIYSHEDDVPVPGATLVTATSPPGSNTTGGFGTIFVLDNVIRESPAGDSPVQGQVVGERIVLKNLNLFLTLTFVVDSPKYTGTISTQGIRKPNEVAILAVTGGTGDFFGATGSLALSVFSATDPGDIVFKSVFRLKYP